MSSDSTDVAVVDRRSESWQPPVWAAPGGPDRADGAPADGGPGRRRRRWPFVVAVVLLLALVASVGLELAGRRYVSDQVEQRLRESGMSGDIDVTVGASPWRPVVFGALAGRGLDELDVQIADGTVGGIDVTSARYRLSDLDGSVSIGSGSVDVRSIGRGDVRIELPASSLSAAAGTEVVVDGGRLYAGGAAAGGGREVGLSVADGSLVLGGPATELWGGPVSVPVADGYLLPCSPSVELTAGQVVLACSGDELPGVLRSPLGGDVGVDPAPGESVPTDELPPPQSTVRDGG